MKDVPKKKFKYASATCEATFSGQLLPKPVSVRYDGGGENDVPCGECVTRLANVASTKNAKHIFLADNTAGPLRTICYSSYRSCCTKFYCVATLVLAFMHVFCTPPLKPMLHVSGVTLLNVVIGITLQIACCTMASLTPPRLLRIFVSLGQTGTNN